ncbi:LysR family transcriptional regulator [Companilactobacillus keshanensis]|uniref:LysR family transcriptional regulator n=1 Tax=Companilactobacillus keshanensis TaxID=2486003 RepID=A0ABW4BTZ3_9LACO|nr:LysR family transcriptional regulator [Companilactobacillus keshanensis]
MDINKLKTFLNVSRSGSFKSAAEKLFLSPRAVSKQMDQIESELGVELFTRNKNSTELNATGKQFIVTAQDIVNSYNDALTRIKTVDETPKDKLEIGFSSMNQATILQTTFLPFLTKHPNIEIELKEESGKRLVHLVERNAIDFAVTPYYALDNEFDGYETVKFIKLTEGELTLGVSRMNPLSDADSISLSKIKDMKLLYYSSSDSIYLRDVFFNKFAGYFKKEQISRVSSLEQRDMLVASNNGIGFYPSPLVTKEKSQNPMIKYLKINDDVNKYYASIFLYNKNNKNPILKKLIDKLS